MASAKAPIKIILAVIAPLLIPAQRLHGEEPDRPQSHWARKTNASNQTYGDHLHYFWRHFLPPF
jgi:hypothetical protein